jgi:hypothetical protein
MTPDGFTAYFFRGDWGVVPPVPPPNDLSPPQAGKIGVFLFSWGGEESRKKQLLQSLVTFWTKKFGKNVFFLQKIFFFRKKFCSKKKM